MDTFSKRHIGPNSEEKLAMLKAIGVSSIDELINGLNKDDSSIDNNYLENEIEFITFDDFFEKGIMLSDSDIIDLDKSIIISNKIDYYIIGIINYCISKLIPIVLVKNETSEFLLGSEYPLFVSNITKQKVFNVLNKSRIENALEHMMDLRDNKYISFEQFIQDFSIGRIYNIVERIYL